jgi:hypothetical protein
MSNADADIPEALATITTAHQLSPSQLECYNIFVKSRAETWKKDVEEDRAIKEIFMRLGHSQAQNAVADAEAHLYNKENESDILNAIIKHEDEKKFTKDELRDAVREIMEKKTPLTEEEVRQLQDEESARVAAILAKDNSKF